MTAKREAYEKYISSPAWKKKREQAFKKYGRRCAGCDSRELLHVHHKTYERFTREPLSDLVIVCETCHGVIHDFHQNRNPKKLSLWKVTELTLVILRNDQNRSNTPEDWVPANIRGYTDPLSRRLPSPAKTPEGYRWTQNRHGGSYLKKINSSKKKKKVRRNDAKLSSSEWNKRGNKVKRKITKKEEFQNDLRTLQAHDPEPPMVFDPKL